MAKGHRSQIKRERNELERQSRKPTAHARYVRISPVKAKYLLDLIRGKDVEQALGILIYTTNKASKVVEKTVRSAMANAENNKGMDVAKLYIETAIANQGPKMKKIKPRGKGSADRIEKKTSHITIALNSR
ncbi:MAG: 50S ribosomal protein L22 [Clostridiales bacterium GWE2_32_10]|nr:MAG: 50S ribosomal protein L22 [Clostridiales bacterium GWE2_32_10]